MALPPLFVVAPEPRDEFDGDDTSVREALVELAGSARRAGKKAVVSGRWLADTVVELAPRIPVRDAAALSAHHDGLTGAKLAKVTTKAAGRVSAGIAAATGALVAAQQLTVATVVLVPFELAAQTALVTATELKLIAELHQVAARPLGDGRLDASRAALLVWASGHALPPPPAGSAGHATDDDGGRDDGEGGSGDGGDGEGRVTLGPAARRQLVAGLRSRYARNLTTLAPFLTGAAAAGVLNRQATLGIGRDVSRDLGLRR
jgi:hypothetical protein